MPARNSQKIYVPNGYYHLYNRGVEKRTLFEDTKDYNVFLSYLKEYLVPKDEKSLREQLVNLSTSPAEKDKILKALRLNNFSGDIFLLCYCLMPNHFHLLVRQGKEDTIDKFMNSLGTRYTMYFNRKYKRVGPLYQSVYKAVLVETDEQLLHLSRYIHRNPISLQSLQGVALQNLPQQASSYADYLHFRKTGWVHPEEILGYFSSSSNQTMLSYQSFVEQSADGSEKMISPLMIDELS